MARVQAVSQGVACPSSPGKGPGNHCDAGRSELPEQHASDRSVLHPCASYSKLSGKQCPWPQDRESSASHLCIYILASWLVTWESRGPGSWLVRHHPRSCRDGLISEPTDKQEAPQFHPWCKLPALPPEWEHKEDSLIPTTLLHCSESGCSPD